MKNVIRIAGILLGLVFISVGFLFGLDQIPSNASNLIPAISFVVMGFGFVYYGFTGRDIINKKRSIYTSGTIKGIGRYIQGLLESTDEHSFLVIKVQGTEWFVQMSASGGSVELDFPMVTKEQKEQRAEIIEITNELGLHLDIHYGSDGTEFLDISIEGDHLKITSNVSVYIQQLFNVDSESVLELYPEGFTVSND